MTKPCRQCGKMPVHRINRCKACLRANARAYYQKNFKAEPHRYAQYKPSPDVLGIEVRIRTKASIRKSLARKFGPGDRKDMRPNYELRSKR